VLSCISYSLSIVFKKRVISVLWLLTLLFLFPTAYRIYTSILFHGSLLHVMFNMLALVPLGSELERIMGSVRLLYMIILLATTNAIFHLFIALVVAHNPFHPAQYLMNECAIGFSGILFSMIVIETNLSGVQSRRLVILMLSLAICYMTRSLLIFNFLHHFRDSICNGSGGTKFPRVMLHTLPLPHTHFHIP
jgi:membrane associated rhomboid family serine protease